MGFYERHNLARVINASGTMTHLGASSVAQPVIDAIAECLPHFVQMSCLQARASATIARVCGSEAGCVTACAAAGVAVGIAACMTGDDLARIEQLPDTAGMKNEVVIMRGHCIGFSVPILQMIRITGAIPVEVGGATKCMEYHLEAGISSSTVAALYVISHHAVQEGQLSLKVFSRICHQHGVPVIVDAASEYDLRRFISDGADLVAYSGHKFLSGPTSGIVAGRKDLVRAAYYQEHGIGRPMKVGKEGIVGAIAALEEWDKRDREGIRRQEQTRIALAAERLKKVPGLRVSVEPDPTHNPIDRLKVEVRPEVAKLTAAQLAAGCMAGNPRVSVRSHHVDFGYFLLDPCNLTDDEMVSACERIEMVCADARKGKVASPSEMMGYIEIMAGWPDIICNVFNPVV